MRLPPNEPETWLQVCLVVCSLLVIDVLFRGLPAAIEIMRHDERDELGRFFTDIKRGNELARTP